MQMLDFCINIKPHIHGANAPLIGWCIKNRLIAFTVTCDLF